MQEQFLSGMQGSKSQHGQEVCPASGCSADKCWVLAHRKGEGSKARPSSMKPRQDAMLEKAWWQIAVCVPIAAVFDYHQCGHNSTHTTLRTMSQACEQLPAVAGIWPLVFVLPLCSLLLNFKIACQAPIGLTRSKSKLSCMWSCCPKKSW